MPSEKQKQYRNKWDKINMKLVACKIRREKSEKFTELATKNNTTPNELLRQFIDQYIETNENNEIHTNNEENQ